MPDSKITALTSISTSTDPANDPLVIVDVSDTSMAATGTTKKVTLNQLLGASGTATLASATISGDLTVDTSTLVVESSTNRVRIAKATAANYPLDVAGRISYSGAIGEGADTTLSSSGTSLLFGNSATWAQQVFYIAGSEAMRLNSTGLGVGASPVSKLTISDAAAYPIRVVATAGTTAGIEFQDPTTGATRPNIASRGAALTIETGGSERLRIDSSGNVGIGVTPITSHILSSAGPIGISGTNSGTRTSYISNSGACSIYYTDGGGSGFFADFGNLIIQPRTSAARSVVIATGSTTPVERAVVKSTGQVRFVPLASDPAGAEAGDVYYNSTSNKLKCYNGTTWNDLF